MNYRIILYLLTVCFLTSCFEDKGNYTYSELEKIQIENVEAKFTKIFMRDRLQISPKIIASDSQADLEGEWTYSGTDKVISKTINLDTLVNWTPGTYHLTLRVTNNNTGYSSFAETMVTVNTEFSVGWYILKDKDGKTDLDLYTEKGKISDVIKLVNGSSLEGEAEKVIFCNNHSIYDPEANKLSRKQLLFVLSNKDMNSLDVLTAKRCQKFEDMFFEVPKKKEPTFMCPGLLGRFICNEGKLHPMNLSGATNGKFWNKVQLDGDYDNYYLSKYAYQNLLKFEILVYDTKSCSFYKCSSSGEMLSPVENAPGTDMDCMKTNKELQFLGQNKQLMGNHFYAVFQDKTDPHIRFISKVRDMNAYGMNYKYISIANDTLIPGTPAFEATIFTVSHSEEVIYFISGNKLYSKNMGGSGKGGAVKEEFEFSETEKATFIRSVMVNKPTRMNYLVLGTESGGQYRIRFFKKTTAGHLDPTPIMELPAKGETAEGQAKDIIYVNPLHATYIPGY